MVDRLVALPRALEQHMQLLLHARLAHEVRKRPGAKRDVELAVLGASRRRLQQSFVGRGGVGLGHGGYRPPFWGGSRRGTAGALPRPPLSPRAGGGPIRAWARR